jgi:hypothetical protein
MISTEIQTAGLLTNLFFEPTQPLGNPEEI